MANVVYNRRSASLQSYDEILINYLESFGETVTVIADSAVKDHDYSDVDLLIIGASGSDWVNNHPANGEMETAPVHILTYCRGAARYVLEMNGTDTNSRSIAVQSFYHVASSHPLQRHLEGDFATSFSLGGEHTSHEIWNCTEDTTLIMRGATDDRAGLAERQVVVGTETYRRIFIGYHDHALINGQGWTVLTNAINTMLNVPDDPKGVAFDGADGKVSIDNDTDYDLSEMTVIARCVTADASANMRVVNREDAWALYTSNNQLSVNIYDRLFVNFDDVLMVNGKVHTLAFTFDPAGAGADLAKVTGFLDGVAVGDFEVSDDPLTSTENLNIGVRETGNWFNGAVDRVLIYNRVLSAVEIAAVKDSGEGEIDTDGLVGWWEGKTTDGKLKDNTTKENHGTLSGTAGWNDVLDLSPVTYKTSGTYAPPPIDVTTLPADVRIRWTADTPTDTSIKVEYSLTATDTEPGTWIEVTESEVIEIDDNYLWLKYTLETEDVKVTPTLEAVWLEELTDLDTIIFTMKPLHRFNNVEGDILVEYDHGIGSIAGEGGAVASFSEGFTPEDLERVPNPHLEESVKGKLSTIVILFQALYHIVIGDGDFPTEDERYQKNKYPGEEGSEYNHENLMGSLNGIEMELIHVDQIDP